MKSEIDQLNEERRADDDKIQTLRDLCDQQDSNIKQLRHEKEEIARMFEEYKQSQEQGLKDIKTNARKREDEQEALLEASRETLNKLRWALNVKENVKGAQ
jgi:predicted  nucleic acid-binding Zn-ribbon protein